MTDSNDSFQKLEEKLYRALEVFNEIQRAKRRVEQEMEKLQGELKQRSKLQGNLERELMALRREREEVRSRLEKLARQIDALTKGNSER